MNKEPTDKMINNRDTAAINFYYYKPLNVECFNCGATEQLNELNDGYDSVICWACMSYSLAKLNCKDDFNSNDFNKEITSCKRFPKSDWK